MMLSLSTGIIYLYITFEADSASSNDILFAWVSETQDFQIMKNSDLDLRNTLLCSRRQENVLKNVYKLAHMFHGLGSLACFESELTFETVNPFRYFSRTPLNGICPPIATPVRTCTVQHNILKRGYTCMP
jgi:hypothetical protein